MSATDTPQRVLHVRDKVLEKIVRKAALSVPGCVTTDSGFLKSTYPLVNVQQAGNKTVINVAICSMWNVSHEKVVRDVQQKVYDDMERLSGSEVDRVNVTLEKVQV